MTDQFTYVSAMAPLSSCAVSTTRAERRMRRLLAIVCFALGIAAGAVRADSWLPAATETYVASEGRWRITIVPRDVSSALAFFDDKVEGRPHAGRRAGDTRTHALGRMEHREGGKWRTVWQQPLSNEVAPVSAVVSNEGLVATFDNWHGTGYGPNAVAIYDGRGKLVRALSLKSFLPPEYIRALPRSVSSIQWRGEPRTQGRQLIVPVVVPSIDPGRNRDAMQYVDVRFDLASGERLPDAGPAWSRALEAARSTARQLDRMEGERRARFVAPLAAPRSNDAPDWYAYLVEAYFRLGETGYPDTKVIPVRGADNFKLMVQYVREALAEGGDPGDALMIASPSQDLLVEVLTSEAAKVRPGALAGVHVYVVVDAAHLQAVRRALAPLGGKLIPLDPAKPIPQHRGRLERFLRSRPDESVQP
jgi:hypothetical protein